MKFILNSCEIPFSFTQTPSRIISLVPSQTELLFNLGLVKSLVGITKFCVHPKELKAQIAQVGGTKKINIKTIKNLNPDIIICNREENTALMVEELSEFCLVLVTDIATINDNINMIFSFGQLFDRENEARLWIDKINSAYTHFKIFIQSQPVKKVVYFIWKNPYMVAAAGTFIDEMLRINNFKNVYENENRYPVIELEKTVEKSPDILFLSSEPYPFKKKDADEITKIITNVKIIFVDGEMFSWYGTRVLEAFGYFRILHSQI